MSWNIVLFVGAGGFLGAVLRFLLSTFIQRSVNTLFPVGTLSVNVLGSFIIGFLALYFEEVIAPEYKALAVTGFLGALTTFSTFSYETVSMLQSGEYYKAFLNVGLNVVFCVGATIAGMYVFRLVYR